jgi:uncharacterized protein YqjF (DUF2071 family)
MSVEPRATAHGGRALGHSVHAGRPEHLWLPVMHQNWFQISFLHWRVDPAVLQSRLPAGLIIDTFETAAWVGLAPFQLTGLTPPVLPPIPWLSAFPEMNLRTYVRGPAGPGVWFFSLDAASALAVLGARIAYGLPYHWATMRIHATGHRMHYTSTRKGARAAITIDVRERLTQPGDLVLFLTERYRLYSRIRGVLAMAAVEHEPWPLQRATLVNLEETVRRAADLPDDATLPLVHYSPGVRVRVGAPRLLRR